MPDRADRTRSAGSRTRPLRAVFFDLDDTLFDHARATRAGLRAVRTELDPDGRGSLREMELRYGALLEQVHPRVLAGRISREGARRWRFRRLAASFDRTISDARADALAASYRSTYQENRYPTAGARELLASLRRRHTLGVVSNNLMAEQAEKLAAIGLEDLFDVLIISEEAGFAKPDPRIYREALRRTRASAGEAVMVGDSWENDVMGARGAGLAAVWYRPGGAGPAREVVRLRSFRPVPESQSAIRRAHRGRRTLD